MLLPEYLCYSAADSYATFISTLQWYRMYCIGKLGSQKADYVAGFEELKRCCLDDLLARYPEGFPESIVRPITELLDKIEHALASRRSTDERIEGVGSLLSDFLREEGTFREVYFEHCITRDARDEYPKELYKAVASFLDRSEYDAAVVAAFKYLEGYLQDALQVSPYEWYGEALVNYAFSPNSGVLQLRASSSEQVGLRNFFSGANALFRNPSAHRSVEYRDFDAQAIIAMVAAMSHLVSDMQRQSGI